MGYFSRRMRTDGLTMGGLSSLLQREIPAIRAALPASLIALLWPREREREREAIPTPMVHRAATAEHTSGRWVLPLVLLCLIPALWWIFNHARRPVVVVPMTGGTANRMIPQAPIAGLPSPVNLYFDTGSSRLQPSSQARLDQFAMAVKGNRDIHIKVSGYTDNVGNNDNNMRLSQSRADAVASDLQNRGIPSGEVTAQGFGEDNAVADNTTADGRSQNRRVTVEAGR
jgi:outer membrane protein OmpA-like peptidoglycan-associated protein